jgi:caa(3)-type oxidase subunit IV
MAKAQVRLWDIWRVPFFVWLALCAALATTCIVAYLPLGTFNIVVSLLIAGFKAVLIGVVFMKLSDRNPLLRLAACAGPLWVFVMFLLLGADYLTR